MADLEGKCPHCNMYTSKFFMDMPYGKTKVKCKPSGYMDTDKDESKYCGKSFYIKVEEVLTVMKR